MKSVSLRDAAAAASKMLEGSPADWKSSTSADACRKRSVWIGVVFEMSHRDVAMKEIAKVSGLRGHATISEEVERWFLLPWWTRYSWLRLASGYLFDGWSEDVGAEVGRLLTAARELETGCGEWPNRVGLRDRGQRTRPRISAATMRGLSTDGKRLRRRSEEVR